PQVLHQRDPVLGARDQDVAERRREDPVDEHAPAEVGEPGFEPRARFRRIVANRPVLAADLADRALDHAVPVEIRAARRAAGEVLVDGAARVAIRVSRRRRDEVGFDRATGGMRKGHQAVSMRGVATRSSLMRILRSAWNTFARALSAEQSRLWPIASYSRSW